MDYEDDDYYSLPFSGRVSPLGWLMEVKRSTARPLCSCCGGSQGVRRPWRHHNQQQPRYKDKRSTHSRG